MLVTKLQNDEVFNGYSRLYFFRTRYVIDNKIAEPYEGINVSSSLVNWLGRCKSRTSFSLAFSIYSVPLENIQRRSHTVGFQARLYGD